MSKLEKVIEQTSYLLEKQRQTQQECRALFEDLLSYVERKINQVQDEEEADALENIYGAIAGQVELLTADASDDISFLTEHLKALNEIKGMKDKEKAQGLLNELIDEQEELLETSDFKEEVSRESDNAKQQLVAMVEDLKNSLEEGNVQEVELYLETLFNNEEGFEDEGEDDGDEYGDEDEDDGGCSSCTGCGTGGGCGSESKGCCSSDEQGDDIFSYFNKDDRSDH